MVLKTEQYEKQVPSWKDLDIEEEEERFKMSPSLVIGRGMEGLSLQHCQSVDWLC